MGDAVIWDGEGAEGLICPNLKYKNYRCLILDETLFCLLLPLFVSFFLCAINPTVSPQFGKAVDIPGLTTINLLFDILIFINY